MDEWDKVQRGKKEFTEICENAEKDCKDIPDKEVSKYVEQEMRG